MATYSPETGMDAAKTVASGASEESSFLTEMRHRMKMAQAAFSRTRQNELDDLKFFAGSSDNSWQWPQDVLATRGSVQGQTT